MSKGEVALDTLWAIEELFPQKGLTLQERLNLAEQEGLISSAERHQLIDYLQGLWSEQVTAALGK